MADLLKTDDTKQKAIKVELPDGTSGEIPIHDAATRTEVVMGYGEGGEVKKYKKGDKIGDLLGAKIAKAAKSGIASGAKAGKRLKRARRQEPTYKGTDYSLTLGPGGYEEELKKVKERKDKKKGWKSEFMERVRAKRAKEDAKKQK
jgi:hypothetical protein